MSTASADRYVASEPYGFFIGGEEVAARETLPAIEPSTGNEWARIGQATADDADRAVEAARVAFRTWRRTSLRERQDALLQLAEVVESWEGWPALLATENGRPIREAIGGDVPIAADIFRYYAGLVRDQSGANLQTGDPNLQVFTVREPLGPIAAIIPWNSPLITTALKLAPALAAGNTVVMKPSEFASASVVEFARRAEGILPAGAINVVTGGPAVGAALVGNPDIAKISFTGGVETARAVMRAANENLTPALLELGGKSAFVVCDDAELEPAVHDALSGIFFQNGQVCFAASRLFVHAEIYETFMNRLLEVARRIRIGDALDPETQVGPLVSAPHRDRVLARITDAQREGASVRAGGSQLTLGRRGCGRPRERHRVRARRRRVDVEPRASPQDRRCARRRHRLGEHLVRHPERAAARRRQAQRARQGDVCRDVARVQLSEGLQHAPDGRAPTTLGLARNAAWRTRSSVAIRPDGSSEGKISLRVRRPSAG